MLTLSLLLATQLVFLLMGLGLTSRCAFLRESGWSVLLAPVVGHVAFVLLSVRLCASFMTGRLAVLLAFAALSLFTLLSVRIAGEAIKRFVLSRDLRWIAGACVCVQVASCLAVIVVGFQTYNGYGNLDAWYYTTDAYLLRDLRLFDVVGQRTFQMNLHTIGLATRVGPEFGVILLSALTGFDELASYNLLLASFLGLIPASVALLCREILALDVKWTLLGILVCGVHSSLQLAYCYQHISQLLALAAVPLGIGLFYLAARRGGLGLWGHACLMGAGSLYVYWPTTPLYALPSGLLAVWVVARKQTGWRPIVGYGLGVLTLALATQPDAFGRYLSVLLESKRFVTRNDPVMVAFNPYLTEDLLPIYTGLTDSGKLSSLWTVVPPDQYRHVALTLVEYHAAAILILALAVVGVVCEGLAGRPLIPIAMAVYASLAGYVLKGEYGYGLYKLVSWTHVMITLSFLLGLRALWSRGAPRSSVLRRALGALTLLFYLFFNAKTAYYYARLSVASTTGRFVTQQNFAGNSDWRTLEDWAQRHPTGPILIGLHQHVAQYWASFRLRRARYLPLVPQDVLGAVSPEDQTRNRLLRETPDPSPLLTLQPDAISQCRYYLDWAGVNDITGPQVRAVPLEANGTFRLYDLNDVQRVLSLYDGWHAFENYDPVTGRTGPFRWMKNEASLLLFRFPKKPVRLVMGVRAGLGAESLERTVTVAHEGEVLSTVAVEGGGRLVSAPFVPGSDVDVVDIRVKERSRPIPRKFTLWNRWVAQDPRSLALGVYDIRAVEEPDMNTIGRPTKPVCKPEDVRQSLVYGGLYSDDWLGRRFQLAVPRGAYRRVVVNGRLVRLGDADFPDRVFVRVNGVAASEVALERYGDFSIPVDLPTTGDGSLDQIELEFEKRLEVQTFYSPGQDVRQISALLRSVEFVGKGLAAP